MKKLVDLLKEVNEGFKTKKSSDGYRTNVNSDSEGNYRRTKIGGSVPKDWQDRKAGVDFIPNQDILDDREAYEKAEKERRAKKISHRSKKTSQGRSWGLRKYVLFPAKSDVFLTKKEEVLNTLRDFLKSTIEKMQASEVYVSLSEEEFDKILSSLSMDSAGNVHYYGPYDLSYKRIGRPLLAIKSDEICEVNPNTLGKVRKSQIFPEDKINQKQLMNRIAKSEPNGEE